MSAAPSGSVSGLWGHAVIDHRTRHLRQTWPDGTPIIDNDHGQNLGDSVCDTLLIANVPDPITTAEPDVCHRCHDWLIAHCRHHFRELP
ncbi:hypothetical protein EV193_101351 [Herbihabitans rhizosphaerae]|uniref:Uncharacterized protein n=1 Tax=Herbihabitans rhizosphaerae TaxID=1872711 RepID=A0A4Q7L580_9PSEU|nr:hypothetical protein [Herbihabitans rhizosphaerae]RZS44475.1 hypothetical protein EV193_101351 [Herbihabitans rhizosphaerae]